MDFEDEKVRKQNKRAAKKKMQLDNLRASIRAPAASSVAFLSSLLTTVSYLGFSAPFSFCLGSLTCLSSLLTCPGTHIAFLFCFLPAPVPESLAVFSFLLVLGPVSPHLTFTTFRIFKRALSDELLRRHSTSFAELLCPFPPLGSLSDKTNGKQTFNIAFINFCPLTGNHASEEIDLSFAECDCPAGVKLNQSWQLELLDLQMVCIIEAIPLVAAIFCNPLFAICYCHTVKLAFRLGLKTRNIISGVVKEKIELV